MLQKELTIEGLSNELAQQKLAVQALTRFLVKKGIVDSDQLNDFIKEVDAEDGLIDGKMTMTQGKVRLRFE